MKRIVVLMFAFSLVAPIAQADGVKAISGSIGMAAVSAAVCTITQVFFPEGEDVPSDAFDRRGFFVGAGGAFAGENFADKPVIDIADNFSNRPGLVSVTVPGPATTANPDDSWSVNWYGGHRCHSRYSVAANFEYFGGFDTSWMGALGAGSDDIDVFAGGVDIKGYLLTDRYQPYLLLGGGTLDISTEVTNPTGIASTAEIPANSGNIVPIFGPVIQGRDYRDWFFRFGAGIDIYATEHVVVNIGGSYILPLGEVSTLDIYTVGGGIEYRF